MPPRRCASTIRRSVEILPLFARLSAAEQDRVFAPRSARRIVLATNVAETSLTVPGIRYVVDTGLARVKRYSYRNKVEQLQIETISQAAANQRAGRCGRVAERHLHPPVRRGGLRSAPEVHRPGDPALVARCGHPAHEVAATWRRSRTSRSSSRRRAARSPTATSCCSELGAVDDDNQLTPLGRELAQAAARPARRPHDPGARAKRLPDARC